MRALFIAVALLFATAPAYAQAPNFGDAKKSTQKDPAREKKEEDAYKSSLQRIQPKETASGDPWGSVRSGNTASQNKPKAPVSPVR